MFLAVKIHSPESTLYLSKEVEAIRLPGVKSSFTVEQGHISLITQLKAGIIRIYREHRTRTDVAVVESGIAYICNNEIQIITEDLVLEDDLNIKFDESELEEILSSKHLTKKDICKIHLLRLRIRAYNIAHGISLF